MPREPAPPDVRPGYGQKTIDENINRLMRDGFPRPMAARIALNKARQSYFKAHPDGFLPSRIAYANKRSRIEYLADGSPSLLPSQYLKNPVPPLAPNAVRQAKKLYSDFTGHDPKNIRKVTQPPPLTTGVAIGPVLGIIYETVRDGVKERYIHKFHKVAARPLLVVSPGGEQMVLLGGAFQFTERGFVDD